MSYPLRDVGALLYKERLPGIVRFFVTRNNLDFLLYCYHMQPSSIHHALLYIAGDRKILSESLWNELAFSPAHRLVDVTVLDIDTARSLITWAQTPYHEPKVAVVSFHTAGVPAQNAMLKMLEEPHPGVRFILVTTNEEQLLPTVLSRVQKMRTEVVQEDTALAREFLSSKHEIRMSIPSIEKLLKQEDEEGRKDREAVRGFILSLLPVLREKKDTALLQQEVLEVASYAGDPSASTKGLVEYLALLLPRV